MDLPKELRDGIDAAVAGVPARDLDDAVQRLIERYRSPAPAETPILGTAADVAAYAAYRMPATYAAVRAVLAQVPFLAPASLVDVGGGTGAAVWAARDAFGSLGTATVLDQVPSVLALGQRIAGSSLPFCSWVPSSVSDPLPAAELVTISYVLSELSPSSQTALVASAAATATEAVVVVEPGTPSGYERILAARSVLVDAGLTVVAPCPHSSQCPLVAPDWCHFGARVNRSALHRRLKNADLSYEDEKFSYVVASRTAPPSPVGRILRRPQQRPRLVALRVCQPSPGVESVLVPKSHRDSYRHARDVGWGDPWP